jgi:uracil-DNA glycosylase
MDLLHQIARCPKVQQWFDCPQCGNPCSEIIKVQHSRHPDTLDQHQVPEPWSGDIEHAKILFLGSNPAIDEEEKFPLWSWQDERIEDFFKNRYGGGLEQWIEDGTRYLLKNGKRRSSDFWSDVRDLAKELLERDVDGGVDYALTEVVHCKPKGQEGIKDALSTCTSLYLDPVIKLSGAKAIIVLGEHAEKAMRKKFTLPDGNVVGPRLVGGRQRYVAFLHHPSYCRRYCRRPDHKHRKPCNFEELDKGTFGELDKEKLQELRAFLR